jgi:hypothetical protein
MFQHGSKTPWLITGTPKDANFHYVTITADQNVLRCSEYTTLLISDNSITSHRGVGEPKDYLPQLFSCL